MVLLVLPNPLRIPQNNPTAAAEYAPVPGKTQNNANANFGETNVADSAGIGSGGIGEGLLPGGQLPPPPKQFKPRQKDCVGNPPRQTEDPLSPPCVPFFDGDNGGATWPGVTEDSIRVVFYNDIGINGEMNGPWKPSDETAGHESDYQQTYFVRTLKAHLNYFQRRYMTYGRVVSLVAKKSGGGVATAPSQRRGDAYLTRAQYSPFAIASLVENAQDFYRVMGDAKIPSFGWNDHVPLSEINEVAPYVWSFSPDQSTEASWSASFICRKLVGRVARFSKDPLLSGKERSFGLLYPHQSQRGPFIEQLALLLKRELKRQCGLDLAATSFTGSGSGEASTHMARFKRDGITTVICYCVPLINETTVTHMQSAATGIGYFPEWYWDNTVDMDRPVWHQTYGSKNHTSFGVTYLWRQPRFEESYAYRAYLETFPATAPNARFNFEVYHILLNLFSAIQAAGPKLTPESVAKGMFTFHYTAPDNPYLPTGSYGLKGPSPYTFMDTASGWWWDPSGTPPGGRRGEGCIRVMREGRRYYTGEWPEGDGDLFLPTDPCTEDTRKIADPGRSTTG